MHLKIIFEMHYYVLILNVFTRLEVHYILVYNIFTNKYDFLQFLAHWLLNLFIGNLHFIFNFKTRTVNFSMHMDV